MAVKAVIGFEHLPYGSAGWAVYSDHGITTPSGTTCPDGTGGIISNGTPAYTYESVNVPLAKYLTLPANKVWFGIRITMLKATTVNNYHPVRIAPTGDAAIGQGTGIGTLFELLGVTSGTNIPLNKALYFEFSVTVGSQAIERRVNGVPLPNISVAAAVTRLALVSLEGSGTTAAPTNRTQWRDIYINDDQGDVTGFLGPQIVSRLGLDASGAGWVTSPAGSTLTQAIAHPSGTSGVGPAALVAVSPADKTPLTVALISNLPVGAVANAIEVTFGSSSTSAGVSNTATSIKKGSDVSQGAVVQAPSSGTYLYNGLAGVFAKAPDGSAWNPAAINASSLILTPDA